MYLDVFSIWPVYVCLILQQELMLRLTKKLSVLRSESVAVNEEIAVNEALGLTVTERVEKVARPQEVAKFRLHVKEVGHITSLLLSLSGRLARAENALLTLSTSHQDRVSSNSLEVVELHQFPVEIVMKQ